MTKTIHSRNYKLFLQRLREARERSGLTQTEFAERIGQTQSFVSKCERGERRIDLIELRSFCDVLSISLTTFVRNLDKELAAK